MWDDGDMVPISALNHYAYCHRRAWLVHKEQIWAENVYTYRGIAVHEAAHEPGRGSSEGVRVERGLSLWSDRLGLIGKGDVVEFRGNTPYPVEYKSGRRKQFQNDEMQLCAQALCLEEMTGIPVTKGALFHAASRARREVDFTFELRHRTEETVKAVRALLRSQAIPAPVADARCRHCSLRDACQTDVVSIPGRLRYLRSRLFTVEAPP